MPINTVLSTVRMRIYKWCAEFVSEKLKLQEILRVWQEEPHLELHIFGLIDRRLLVDWDTRHHISVG